MLEGVSSHLTDSQRNDLASAYVNRGNAKQDAPGHGPAAAITDYDAAIQLREALRDTLGEGWPVPWRNDLAGAYMNRGNAKQDAPGHGPAAAITDYDAAIRLMQALRDTSGEGWPVPWRNDLARAYMNRGNAKQSAPGHGPAAAIMDYDAAIRLMEALRDTLGEGWPVPWRNDLANAYVNRGNAKQDAPGHGPAAAITDYDAAIRLMEALRDTSGEGWPVPWRNDLANAYMNRGNAKQSAPGHGPAAAITDYDAAIRLREALRDTLGEGWPVPWRNHLANAYMNRGNAKQSAPGHGPAAAITDYDAAIRLREALRDTLGEGWPVPWRNDLARAYMNRGNAKQDSPSHEAAAVADYREADALLAPLFHTGVALHPAAADVKLRLSYSHASALRRLGNHAQARDVVEDGLRVGRYAEQCGVRWYRSGRARLFALALPIYRAAGMAHALPELIFLDLDPSSPGSAADSAPMHQAATDAIRAALNDVARDETAAAEALRARLLEASDRLASIQLRRFAGTAALASMRAVGEAAAGRPDEAERILTRQVTYRPDDPEGFRVRAGFLLGLGRGAEAEADLRHAAGLVVTALPDPGEKGAATVAALCDMLLTDRLDRIATDPAHADPGRHAETQTAFDRLNIWLNRGLVRAMFPHGVPAAWQAPLEAELAVLWHQAAALRETILAAQARRWEGDLRAEIAERAARIGQVASELLLGIFPLPWSGFVQAILLAFDQAFAAPPGAAWEATLVETLEDALRTETARLADGALDAEKAQLAATLGPHWAALTPAEQRYLACAWRCAAISGLEKFAVLELGCAVEWSLLDRLLLPLRHAIQQRRHEHPITEGADKFHTFMTGSSATMTLFPLLRGYTEAVRLARGHDRPLTAHGAVADWLTRQPNPAALHGTDAAADRRRRAALLALPQARNPVAHGNPADPAFIPPDFAPHWQTIVADPADAFFRYFPALFADAGRSAPGAG